MFLKPFALPRPIDIGLLTERLRTDGKRERESVAALQERQQALAQQLGRVNARLEEFFLESECGSRDDSKDVESYAGSFAGISPDFVRTHQGPVGQLQWLDLFGRFQGLRESPGQVSKQRWASGALIDVGGRKDLFLTAAHCFRSMLDGNERPTRNHVPIEAEEAATLMQVNFNYQRDAQSGQAHPDLSFPIVELVDIGKIVDFAIVRLAPNDAGKLPGELFGTLSLAAADVTQAGTTLCLMHHPNRGPKMVIAGPLHAKVAGRLTYGSIDTTNSSSGAPLLNGAGEVVGVHTKGGCQFTTGNNSGAAIGAIREESTKL